MGREGGVYFDYNWVTGKRSRAWTLAGFFPLWAGVATRAEAERMRARLRHFEHAGGLATTRRVYRGKKGRQWDFPTGWPNLQWIVVKGLARYGYRDDALRVARKWLDMVHDVFVRTGRFWEKYDVVRRRPSQVGRYETQWGFGWTNSVFVKLLEEFGEG